MKVRKSQRERRLQGSEIPSRYLYYCQPSARGRDSTRICLPCRYLYLPDPAKHSSQAEFGS
ncbi:hypothetical protein FA13DRAFT_166270 [Coprinellus micaceus]|uniref:Uncharacterized protein n=1 Tax=Coprinellus micaceus TaxID=71717 RepID=A0A4Y7SHI9_COPMI|nr:hypothetical protein FA13DRAFT_166270 [Coprinellus micaceus]